MTEQLTPIAQTPNFIVLDKYQRIEQPTSFQSESDLEKELVADLQNQGYEYCPDLNTPQKLLANIRNELQRLNKMAFSDNEWQRFVDEYLNKKSDTLIDKTRRFHNNDIYDFVFDDGHIQNIYLFDKKHLGNNKLQVIRQFEQIGKHTNRYDVSLLINGLPVVQIELKKRGVAIREAFNQVHRYSKESFNEQNSLYQYLQIFIISNGTDTRYFANTTERNKNSFDFTINWADKENKLIRDLKDFTATFLQKNTLLKVLFDYSVFDAQNTLLIMRPYQIAATERILWKINSAYQSNNWSNPQSGGFIWHTTGSGKTLTSFKAARLATQLDFIDKVLFVVDRKDLDFQTMKEYQRFSPDSVNGSNNTAGLKANLAKDDNKIVVTTIQKLNNLMKSENDLAIYQKAVVFIFDECHRSQFGEAQKNIRKKFKKYCQFGFTGTPIFPENAVGSDTTQSVFGVMLHSYVITDAIRDNKVLKFKVDYNDVRPQFRTIEKEIDEEKLSSAEIKQAFLHPERIREISQYILDNFNIKTHRNNYSGKGFNAMFAVSSVEAAKLYYETLQKLQAKSPKQPLKIATIFSFASNEEQSAIGDIEEENFEPTAMNSSAKEFLAKAVDDYNKMFRSNYNLERFQEYYRDLSNKVKSQEIDLLIVVGMFLTGFDAPTLNTLFVDKNLRYHGLLQAFSRTNRIYNANKSFGNIVAFRNLEQATIDALTLFGNKNTPAVILEKPYQDYIDGYTDENGKTQLGFMEIVKSLQNQFPNPDEITTDKDKKDFVQLFGQYLKMENILQNYDEFSALQELQQVDIQDENAVLQIQQKYGLSDEVIAEIQKTPVLSIRQIQDYCSIYNDIRDEIRERKRAEKEEQSQIDWSDVVFEVELLKTQEINLDYILELIFKHNKEVNDKEKLIEEIRRTIRASLGHRAKESLIVGFINQTDLDRLPEKADVIEAFFQYARDEQKRDAEELIAAENLEIEAAKRYIQISVQKGYASEFGTGLHEILPKMSPLNPQYKTKKDSVFQKIAAFVEKFKGIGGEIG